MGNQYVVSDEFLDSIHRFFDGRAIFDHLIGDVGLGLDLLWDMHLWIDQNIQSVDHHAVFHYDPAEFGNAVKNSRKSSGFQVEDAITGVAQ